MTTASEVCFEAAKSVFVGGVNSPVRAFKSVGGTPVFMKEGQGPYLVSEDNQRYIDYVLSWGPMLVGHAHPKVVSALQAAVAKGTSFGTPGRLETELAVLVQQFFPSMEKLRFVSSGTEATMSAIRLARGATQRPYILKFNGCYHGHVDSLLVAAGSGALTFGHPDSAGVPQALAEQTLVADYNDTEQVQALFKAHGHHIAGVIVEPVCGNMGVILPKPGFLETLRQLCTAHDAILIFDEVMTGFRVAPGGAQEKFGITPDLTCLGKVIGGGLPCGAFGGRADLMGHLSPEGPVYQAGTLSGNPIAMTAGIATLGILKEEPVFKTAAESTDFLTTGLNQILNGKYTVNTIGTMFSIFFCSGTVEGTADTRRVDTAAFRQYYHRMLDLGIYLAPSAFEANFLSSAHSSADLVATLAAFEKAV
ncbi:MAG: glutamate-1-semialdehyde 2,1-aminomutase [Candidatus Margulisiibacteriota bacterium]